MAHLTGRTRGILATLAVLVPVVGFVVWSSFHVSRYECEVCIEYRGREVCRTVTAATEGEALRSATDNACALLSSGITDSLRCGRTPPTRTRCRQL